MSLSKRKKQFMIERLRCNPENECVECGKSMVGCSHHFLCNDCYVPGKMYSQEIRKKIFDEKKLGCK